MPEQPRPAVTCLLGALSEILETDFDSGTNIADLIIEKVNGRNLNREAWKAGLRRLEVRGQQELLKEDSIINQPSQINDQLETIMGEVLEVMMTLYYHLNKGDQIFSNNAPGGFHSRVENLADYQCDDILMSKIRPNERILKRFAGDTSRNHGRLRNNGHSIMQKDIGIDLALIFSCREPVSRPWYSWLF